MSLRDGFIAGFCKVEIFCASVPHIAVEPNTLGWSVLVALALLLWAIVLRIFVSFFKEDSRELFTLIYIVVSVVLFIGYVVSGFR